ncbi:hypothetical protein CHK_1482 [Christensenella hongkongensis]|uniref:Uncharacterized protein n=1 Tax=Christensenella hongkongensis TaxID=270498 RepID=A0A0M2NLH5_9FIRM|nr:hypothetical protein CHK_1482 [Christensenella hongkongensis]
MIQSKRQTILTTYKNITKNRQRAGFFIAECAASAYPSIQLFS